MKMDFSDEMQKRQELIQEKLAEIGIQLASGVGFSHADDNVVVQILGVWTEDAAVGEAVEVRDEFEAIIQAEREAEMEQKARELEAMRLEAIEELRRSQENDE